MWSFERFSRAAFAGVMVALLSACGFHLRGQAELPFETLYIPGANPLVVELKRNVAAASKARLVDTPGDAQAVLGFTHDLRETGILSFNPAVPLRDSRRSGAARARGRRRDPLSRTRRRIFRTGRPRGGARLSLGRARRERRKPLALRRQEAD